eukprot:scaffold48038_cov18-Tisochrysis_lutea.AAC.2
MLPVLKGSNLRFAVPNFAAKWAALWTDAEDEVETKFLENLDPCQQRSIAEGYRTFVDGWVGCWKYSCAGRAAGSVIVQET